MTLRLSDKAEARIEEIKKRYPSVRSAIMPALYIAQEELGYLSDEAIEWAAERVGIAPVAAREVATFYTMFHLDPVGKNVLEVCRTGPCQLVGSDDIISYIEQKLDIKVGETSKDGMFTLKTVECLGACGYGPMLMCKYKFYEHLTKEKVNELLDAMRDASQS